MTQLSEGVQAAIQKRAVAAPNLIDALLQAAPVALAALQAQRDEKGHITDFRFAQANGCFVAIFGSNASKANSSFGTLFPAANGLFELKCRVLETGEPFSNELVYEAGGASRWLLFSVSKMDDNTLAAAFTDISETKRQREAQLQQYDQRLKTIFETAHAGMYTLTPVRDAAGNIIDFRFGLVNQAVAAYLDLDADDLTGSLGSVYFPAYKTNGLFDRYIETMTTGKPATFDLHYAAGYDNYFTINVVKIGDELFGTFTDHSPLKRLQRDLEASIAELKRSNTSLEQFAHAASHDLQEPLRKMMLYTIRLEEVYGDSLNDEAFGFLERIKTAGKRMQRLIKDLLVFAEVGARRPDFEELALNPLLNEVLNDLEVAISERDATLDVGELGTVKGDGLHLQQLFQNLITNALKYSRTDVAPHISISASAVQGKDAAIDMGTYEAEKAYLKIVVQDNGQGFTDEQAKQIFKIFQRLPQHRHEYAGTGIGLAIVQRVVENHKGFIKAEGIPGEGATFTILLPMDEQ